MTKFLCKISRNHTTYVKVGGVEQKITFDNSDGNAAGFGEFVTKDKALIAALKEDSRYGKSWFCIENLEQITSVDIDQASPPLKDHLCRTANEAMEWLMSLGCKRVDVVTSKKAIEVARNLGYNLKFERE